MPAENKGGHPGVSLDGGKTEQRSIRMSNLEWAVMSADAKVNGLSIAGLIRRRCIGQDSSAFREKCAELGIVLTSSSVG